MLTKRVKTAVIKNVAINPQDTGSADVQVAILTRKIEELSAHLKKNHKDFHSRRGLLQMVADRRTHLRYLEKNDKRRYATLIKKLGLKK
jgi:small subunit ribosomal protein S15